VLPLVPQSLPPRAPQRRGCTDTKTVTIEFANGHAARYGPCGLPQAIGWLAASVEEEAAQWSVALGTHTAIVGASPAEEREVRRLLDELGPSPIRTITFGVAWTVDAGPSVRGEWEAGLVAHLYQLDAERLHLRGVDELINAPGGKNAGGGPVRATAFARSGADLGRVRAAVEAGGARVVELRRLHDAIEIIVRADDPAAFLKHSGRGVLDVLRRPARGSDAHPSAFFGVEDGSGSVVYAGGWLPDEGMVWSRPDLDACGPIEHDVPLGYSAPTCPA
jgi:hypothetical protein